MDNAISSDGVSIAYEVRGVGEPVKTISTISHLVIWETPDEFNRLLEDAVQEFVQMAKSK